MRLRDLYGPVAASTFAGFWGAGLADVAITVARADEVAPVGPLLVMALGLYGVAGLAIGVALGLLVGGVARSTPGGFRGVRDDAARDVDAAAALLAGVVGVVVLALAAAAGQRLFVGKMASQLLATIAAAGVVVLAAPVAAAVALGLLDVSRKVVAAVLPRPRGLGRTGVVLLALLIGGLLGALLALSRADWRVLDLGPLLALGLAGVLAAAHGGFWYGSAAGVRLRRRIPGALMAPVVAVAALGALLTAARLPEGAPVYPAVTSGSAGLRFGVQLARALTDRDGDGFSARFGGGDCDDRTATVYPGAEDAPGDGVDGNCEGGDAKIVAEDHRDSAPPAPAAETKPVAPAAGAFSGNVLVVTIDALRADRLGVAGYGRPAGRSLTPTLDALAGRGAYFRRVWSHAPNTPRSFPAILTSRYPSEIVWDKPGVNYPTVMPANKTFFEGLAAVGLRPIGVFSHFYFTPERGLNKGFAEWSNDGAGTIAESNKDVAAPRIVPRVIQRLRQAAARKERFALWTHLFEPHSSYLTHKEFPTSLSGVPGLMEKYDYEIAFVDRWLGKLLAEIKALGLEENTAVVVMADHGEAWGEHKFYFHGQDLFDEQLRVPLIIAIPGKGPRVIDQDVALIDVAPTLLELTGAPVPAAFRGKSLMACIDGGVCDRGPVFAELLPATAWPHHATMMVDGGMKIIHRISARRWELYDLRADPGERKNLADSAAARPRFEALKTALLAFEERKK